MAFVAGTALLYAPVVHGSWDSTRVPRRALAAELDRLACRPRPAMSIDASGFKYWTGRGGVVSPDDPIDAIEDVARGYDIRWLVLERHAVVEALRPVLADDERPAWIGAPVFEVASTSPTACRSWPSTRSASSRTTIAARSPGRDPPRGLGCSALLVFVVALVDARDLRAPDRLPEAGRHRLLLRRRPQPARGPRARH